MLPYLLENYSRCILYVLFGISAFLMILDLAFGITEALFFYMIANGIGILIFRLFGGLLIEKIIHASIFIVVFLILCMLDFDNTNLDNTLAVFLPLIIQMVLSILLVYCLRGRTLAQKAILVSLHSICGLLVLIMFFWVCCFIAQSSSLQNILEMFYMLIFLLIILTPHFRSSTQASVLADNEKKKRKPISDKDCPSMAIPPAKPKPKPEPKFTRREPRILQVKRLADAYESNTNTLIPPSVSNEEGTKSLKKAKLTKKQSVSFQDVSPKIPRRQRSTKEKPDYIPYKTYENRPFQPKSKILQVNRLAHNDKTAAVANKPSTSTANQSSPSPGDQTTTSKAETATLVTSGQSRSPNPSISIRNTLSSPSNQATTSNQSNKPSRSISK